MLSVFFCNKQSEIRDGTKERMQENREIDMTDEDRENKSEIRGIAPSSYPAQKIYEGSRPLPLYR